MKIQRPLMNPSAEDEQVYYDNGFNKIEPKAIEPEVSKDQLQFKIDSRRVTFEQRLNSLKMFIRKRQEVLEISILWKNPGLPFAIVTLSFIVLLLIIGGIFEFDKIPLKIPFYYNSIDKHWEQIDKSIIFLIGFGLLIIEGFTASLVSKIFKTDRRLALVLCWMLTFLNLLILIGILQIYSLIV